MADDASTEGGVIGPLRLKVVAENNESPEAAVKQAERLARQYAQTIPGGRVEHPKEADTGPDFIVRDAEGNPVLLVEAKYLAPSEQLANAKRTLEAVRARNEQQRERLSRLRERVSS